MSLFKIAYGFALAAWAVILLCVAGIAMTMLYFKDASLFWIAVVIVAVAVGATSFLRIGTRYLKHNETW